MILFRSAALTALALVAILQSAETASADHRHRMRVLWPRIYAPEISGYLYRDVYDNEEDDDFLDLESEDEYRTRNRRDRRIVLEVYDDDLEPEYLPPKKAKAKKPVKKVALKKPVVKKTVATASLAKPETKPPTLLEVKLASAKTDAKQVTAKTPLATAAIAPKLQLPVVKTAPGKSQVASAGATSGTIGCSKGAEIVSGYGFTSVKPRTCTGSSYSFAASRGASGYLIMLSAATGEITDVQKLK
jgi:hypothetical protein